MNNQKKLCPCCSGKNYEECCKLFHAGKLPKNALELMRSRYSAYVLDIADYIIATTHPGSPQYSENKFSWKRNISQFSKNSFFKKLEILDFKENNTLATVVFTAHITENGHDATFTEKSYFEKIGEKWLYRAGLLEEGRAPNLVTNEQLRLLPLAYYGDAILRRKADSILEITEDIKQLTQDMIETMEACNGAGLAAPQVHHSIRLFIVELPVATGESEEEEPGEYVVFINPKLSDPSKETWKASEGCLSIPSMRGSVERPKEITCEYTNLEGKLIKQRFKGWDARAVMHENDHINGVLYVDRLDGKEKTRLEPLLKNLEKRMNEGVML